MQHKVSFWNSLSEEVVEEDSKGRFKKGQMTDPVIAIKQNSKEVSSDISMMVDAKKCNEQGIDHSGQ